MSRKSASGQALMVAILIMCVLIIAIPAVITMTGASFRQGTRTMQRQHARQIAEEGLQKAMFELSAPNIWPPQRNRLPAAYGPPSANSTFTVGESTYTVEYSALPPLRGVFTVIAYVPDKGRKNGIHARIDAVVRGHTLGMSTANNNGISAPAALQLNAPPVVEGTLDVHWGPVVVLNDGLWTVKGDMNTRRYPRKFTQGGITGDPATGTLSRVPSSSPPNTDNQEYWAFLSPDVPEISRPVYLAFANIAEVYAPQFWTAAAGPYPQPCGAAGIIRCDPLTSPVSGRMTANPGERIVFGTRQTSPPYNPYIAEWGERYSYLITGDAEWRDISINLRSMPLYGGGGFIVEGNLAIKAPADDDCGIDLPDPTSGPGDLLPVPSTANKEYPYFDGWPCAGEQGKLCDISNESHAGNHYINSAMGLKPRFRGFLYVTGDLDIDAAPSTKPVTLIGSIRVDGTLRVRAGSTLRIFFDEAVNHGITVSPNKLIVESRSDKIY